MEVRKEIGKRIRQLRKNRKMTQAELARRTGYLRSSITNIEVGRNGNLSIWGLLRICEALQEEPADMLLRPEDWRDHIAWDEDYQRRVVRKEWKNG